MRDGDAMEHHLIFDFFEVQSFYPSEPTQARRLFLRFLGCGPLVFRRTFHPNNRRCLAEGKEAGQGRSPTSHQGRLGIFDDSVAAAGGTALP